VAALAARAPRLPRLPTAGHLRGLDEDGRRAQRLLAALPRLRARHQRVPLAEGRDARGARLRRVEPALRRGRPPPPGRFLHAARLIAGSAVGVGLYTTATAPIETLEPSRASRLRAAPPRLAPGASREDDPLAS